jgi:hypothetical protein
VKSSATSAVKQILKPDAYKQSEPDHDLRIGGWVTAYLLYNGSASYRLRRA